MDTAILVTEHCFIRPYVASDVESIVREGDNPNVSHYMTNAFPSPYTLANAEAWVRIATEGAPLRHFAICKLDGTYIGGIGLKTKTDVEYRTMEVGYWIGEAHWGQGLATECALAFSRWSFETIPELLRLETGIYEGNDASIRVLTKAGYTFEGTRRKAGFKFEKSFDIRTMSMLRSECPGLKENKNEGE